jgi:signal transduction histidine kinase
MRFPFLILAEGLSIYRALSVPEYLRAPETEERPYYLSCRRVDRMKKQKTGKTRKRVSAKRPPRSQTNTLSCLTAAQLRKNILFKGVRPATIEKALPRFTRRRFKPGDLIFDEYSTGRDLFLLCKGRIRIKKYTKYGVESLLAVLHRGDFFGELSLIDGLPRSARAEAIDDCELACISASTFRVLVEHNRHIALNLLHQLALRLRTMDQAFVMELGRSILASKTKLDRLGTLIEAIKTVNSNIDLESLLGLIQEVAARAVNAESAILFLFDHRHGELWSRVSRKGQTGETRIPIGIGLAGYVARTGELVNITDTSHDPRFNHEMDKTADLHIRSLLCTPIRDKEGKVLGIFQILNKRTGVFGPEDEAFIEALSVHVSIALQNAYMVREMMEHERLAAVGRMAAGIMHDIRDPLANVRLQAELLKHKTTPAEASRVADMIIQQLDRFASMTQEVLDFARGVSALKLETVQVGPLLHDVLTSLEADFKKCNVSVSRELHYTGSWRLDREKLTRALYNLASNAADAMYNGGVMTVRTQKEGSLLIIEVADSGPGIPDAVRARIFEPFFSHEKTHGTGLGLAIVKKILDDHHGTVEVDSEPGRGTTFRLLFPSA